MLTKEQFTVLAEWIRAELRFELAKQKSGKDVHREFDAVSVAIEAAIKLLVQK